MISSTKLHICYLNETVYSEIVFYIFLITNYKIKYQMIVKTKLRKSKIKCK